jgi:hypothetical protein
MLMATTIVEQPQVQDANPKLQNMIAARKNLSDAESRAPH